MFPDWSLCINTEVIIIPYMRNFINLPECTHYVVCILKPLGMYDTVAQHKRLSGMSLQNQVIALPSSFRLSWSASKSKIGYTKVCRASLEPQFTSSLAN